MNITVYLVFCGNIEVLTAFGAVGFVFCGRVVGSGACAVAFPNGAGLTAARTPRFHIFLVKV